MGMTCRVFVSPSLLCLIFSDFVENSLFLGCTSGRASTSDSQSESVEQKPKAKGGQQQIDHYFTSKEKTDGQGHQNKNNQSPKVSQFRKL